MAQYVWKDAPDHVQAQVQKLTAETVRIFGSDNVEGIYLHGSLAMGCFHPAQSDIDVLVVTWKNTTVESKRELMKFLLELSSDPCPIEISVVQHAYIRPWKFPTPFDFHYSEMWRPQFESLSISQLAFPEPVATDIDLAAHITITRHRGVVLFGEPIHRVFPEVPGEDYLAAICEDVSSSLEACLEAEGGQGPSPNFIYCVLNTCRVLAFLADNRVYSKDEGGEWALHWLPDQYHPVVQLTLDAYRRGDTELGERTRDDIKQFVLFARSTMNKLIEGK